MWNPKEKRKKSQAQIYTKQIGGCQRQGAGVDESAKCVKMIQTSKKKMIQTSSN